MSHFTVLVRFNKEQSQAIVDMHKSGGNICDTMHSFLEDKLLPFQEDTKNLPKEYVEFQEEATVEELQKEYETGSFDDECYAKESDKYKKSYQEFYGSFDNFVKKYHGYETHNGQYGFFRNPNAKWDWWCIGGRWMGALFLKPNGVGGLDAANLESRRKYKDLYGEVEIKPTMADWCQIKDFDFEANKQDALKDIDDFMKKYETFIKLEKKDKKEFTKEEQDFWYNTFYFNDRLMKLGIRKLIQGRQQLLNDDGSPFKDENGDFQYSSPIFEDVPFTKEELIEKIYLFDFSTYAILTEDGKWLSPGDMGWWGMSSEDDESYNLYKKMFKENALGGSEETVICVVDCHI